MKLILSVVVLVLASSLVICTFLLPKTILLSIQVFISRAQASSTKLRRRHSGPASGDDRRNSGSHSHSYCTINENALSSQILANSVRILKNLPYQQCTRDLIVDEVADSWKAIDKNIAYIYAELPYFGYTEATAPLASFRAGCAQILASLVTKLQTVPRRSSECGRIPADIEHSVRVMKTAAEKLRNAYEALRVRLTRWRSEGHRVNATEFFGKILPVLLDGIWIVSIYFQKLCFFVVRLIEPYFLFCIYSIALRDRQRCRQSFCFPIQSLISNQLHYYSTISKSA